MAEIHLRWNVVEDLLNAGLPDHKVVAEAVKLWSISERTVKRYIASVRERWKEERMLALPSDREARLARMKHMAFKCERKEAWAAAARYDHEANEILGVLAPQRIDLRASGVVQIAPQSEVLNVLDGASDSLLDELARLLEGRRAAKALPAQVVVIDAPAKP